MFLSRLLFIKKIAYIPCYSICFSSDFLYCSLFPIQLRMEVGTESSMGRHVEKRPSIRNALVFFVSLVRIAENVDHNILSEMEKDISRLETTAQRFSKIGSMPSLKVENIQEVIRNFIEYFKDRTSEKIKFKLKLPENDIFININKYLFEWVIENLCKMLLTQWMDKNHYHYFNRRKDMYT